MTAPSKGLPMDWLCIVRTFPLMEVMAPDMVFISSGDLKNPPTVLFSTILFAVVKPVA